MEKRYRAEKSLNQGAKWKALISKYIATIPPNGDAPGVAEQSISGAPPRTPVSSAMIVNVGAAARYRKSAAPIAAALPLSQGIAPGPRVTACVSLMVFSCSKAKLSLPARSRSRSPARASDGLRRLAALFPHGGLAGVRHLDPFLVGCGVRDVTVVPVPPFVGWRLR